MSMRSLPAIGLVAMALAGCGSEPPAPTPPSVEATTPERREVTAYADFPGVTRAIEYAEIRARVQGVLEEVRFTPGMPVEEGQVLFLIEQGPYAAALAEAEGALQVAQAEARRAAVDLARIEEAIRTDAVSQSELDRATAARDQAEASVLSAEARVARAQLDYDYTLVRSPVSGRAGRNLLDPGNLVGAGEPTLLTDVARVDSMFVYFDVPEAFVLAFTNPAGSDEREVPQQLVRLTSADASGISLEGVVDFVDNQVDAATGTIEVRAIFENTGGALVPGIFVRVRAFGAPIPDAIVIDEKGIAIDLGGQYVLVVGDDNVVEQRYIELGPREDDGFVVVRSGLEADERYIVNGLFRARPGFPVTVESPSAAGASTPDTAAGGN
jgi:RND family efflux transporter MFP subunit